MDNIEMIKMRRSIRVFESRPVEPAVLEQIVDAARFAPTARGIQPWEFIVVTQALTLEQLAGITDHGRFIAQAPACLVIVSRDTKYYLEDCSAATQTALLAATALGVGSCWVAGDKKPYADQICELLHVPAGYKLVSLVALGYPRSAGSSGAAEKRPLDSVLHWEKF